MNSTNAPLFIKRSIKTVASFARSRIGYPRTATGSVNVFAYHRVVADIAKAEREAVYGVVISTETFRRHCEMLSRAFDVVSLETATHFLSKRSRVSRPLAVITFDDGYQDFYDEAFPVLNDLSLPATMFLPTGYVGNTTPLPHDRIFWLLKLAIESRISVATAIEGCGVVGPKFDQLLAAGKLLRATDLLVYQPFKRREIIIRALEAKLADKFVGYPSEYELLSWERVRDMSRKGIGFGSHTVNHVVLPLEDRTTVISELVDSKARLEAEINKSVISFAFPNGEYHDDIKRTAKTAGYRIAVTTESKLNRTGADLLSLGRTSLCEESTRGLAGTFSPGVARLRLGV